MKKMMLLTSIILHPSTLVILLPNNGKEWKVGEIGSNNNFPSGSVAKLNKMTFEEIQKLKIFQDNKEEIMKKALEEAIRIDARQLFFKIDTVIFRVHYCTDFGEIVYITGEGRIFGNWDVENKGIRLKWNEGHYWSVAISTDELPNKGEYKYTICEGDKVKKWGQGDNKRFNIDIIKEAINNTQLSKDTQKYELEMSWNINSSHSDGGNPSGTSKIEYDPKLKELCITDSFD